MDVHRIQASTPSDPTQEYVSGSDESEFYRHHMNNKSAEHVHEFIDEDEFKQDLRDSGLDFSTG
jgi:hypothetical protein